jgi:hypothetical protein
LSTPPISIGALTPWSSQGDYNTHFFAIQQALSKLQTATLVRVEACTNNGGVSPIGTVDVTPLVNQIDALGNATPHITVFGLPYLRIQGGTNAVIIDPQPGDIGVAVFASRDISKVKNTQAQANPGSGRQYEFPDGIYLGTVLSKAAPQQYIQFNSGGINLVSPQEIQIQSSGDTDITASGNIILSGATIKAGSSPVPVVSQPFITWVTTVLLPALATHGIIVTAPPGNSVTTIFEAS